MNVEGLKNHLKPFIDLIKESGSEYFWIASGAIRDYFITGGVTAKDVDIFFVNTAAKNKAVQYLVEQGFKTVKLLPRNQGAKFNLTNGAVPEKYSYLAQGNEYAYRSMDIGCWDGRENTRGRCASTPEECISWFDFTVEMASLDSNHEFICHPDFEHHITNKILVRNSIQDAFPRGNNRRLLKYIKNGFSIDNENLLQWLEDQEATFAYRKETRKQKIK
tara:strand:- start:8884 stop:9540 length:657 start_codon:yes stop_codon:yes gene_type:complete